jgi:hypothetical protein
MRRAVIDQAGVAAEDGGLLGRLRSIDWRDDTGAIRIKGLPEEPEEVTPGTLQRASDPLRVDPRDPFTTRPPNTRGRYIVYKVVELLTKVVGHGRN